jgi:hypothetical protein
LVLSGFGVRPRGGVNLVKCHYHPRANATTECSICGVALCRRCAIEDRGSVYCDGCYAAGDDEAKDLTREELEHEDYIDLELMDLLDTEDDAGLL